MITFLTKWKGKRKTKVCQNQKGESMSESENRCPNAKAAYFSWQDIDSLSRKLARIIKISGFTPEIIVGIQRGGCILAVFLSHLLGVRDFCTIGVRTTTAADIQAPRQSPVVIDDSSLRQVTGKRVLVVDDVTNTGATLIIAKNRVLIFSCKEVRTVVLVWDTTNVKSCLADYYGTAVDAWVVFPWEK